MTSVGPSEDSDTDLYADERSESLHDDDDSLFLEADVLPGWKRVFHLPFEPVWSNSLLLMAYSQIYLSVYTAGFNVYGQQNSSVRLDEFGVLNYFADSMYLIDIVLTFACKNLHGLYISPSRIHHPTWILVMDLLSLIPAEQFIPTPSLTPLRAKLYYIIQLNDCLKIGRILYTFNHCHSVIGRQSLCLRLLEYSLNMMLAILIGAAVTYNTFCSVYICNSPLKFIDHVGFLYISMCKVTTKGFTKYPGLLSWMFYITIIACIVYMYIICVTLSHVIIIMLTHYHHKYRYLYKLFLVQKVLKVYNISKGSADRCLKFFETFWRIQGGYDINVEYLSILPLILREEIALDGSWYTLKHSKLFRDMDLPFLRYLSMFIKPKCMHPGEIIYDKQSVKDMMVYLISGVVQVLSEEDDETAILSFSGGTCLGEISLMLSYESKATVRCKTYCTLQILERKDIIKTIPMFPNQYAQLRRDFKKRLADAMELVDMSNTIHSYRSLDEITEKMTIMWLKSTLHRLMIKGGDTSAKHECQNIFLRSEFNEQKFIDENFTARYLDMLVISERLELVTDTVFLKTSCPCILQPESLILNAWDTFIMMLAITIAFVGPYFAFVEPSTPFWYNACIYIATVFWWIDIYVQASVAVKTPEGIIATVRGIFIYRMSTVAFLVEFLAAIPLEMLSCILLSKITGQTIAILQLNRIFKLWKIHIAIKKWENQLHYDSVFIRYYKYSCASVYLIFICSCLLYGLNCFNFVCIEKISTKGNTMELFWYALSVTQILTGVSMSIYYTSKFIYYPLYLILTFISSILYIIVYGDISAAQALKGLTKIRVQELLTDIMTIISANELGHKFDNRILQYVETQWIDNNASMLLKSQSIFANVPLNIVIPICEELNAKIIRAVPLFEQLPEDLILELCVTSNNVIVPPNEVICYAGEISNTFHIIDRGFCKIASGATNINKRILGPNESISVIETCVRMPVANTVISITHCRLLSISYTVLMRALAKFPTYMTELKSTFTSVESQISLLVRANPIDANYVFTEQNEIMNSFYIFGYNLKLDSFEEYDYYIPFDRLDFFPFVQYFLLRCTILPESKFLFIWETIRCICAILSAILFPISSIGACSECMWFYLLIFLDSMAWLDIYVRFHVCHYNEDGVLVAHPLKTASYYLRHAFIIDLLAVFPLNLFYTIFGSPLYGTNLARLQINRVLQIYRYIGFVDYYSETNLLPAKLFSIFKYFPILVVLCSSVGSLNVNYGCRFGKDIKNPPDSLFTDGVHCRDDMWLVNSLFHKPLSQSRIQMYGIYFVTTIITQAGVLGSTIHADTTAVIGTILAMCGYIISLHIVSKAIAEYTSHDSTLLAYQGSMVSVRTFMNSHNINPDLQKQLIAHHEFKWKRKRGKDIHFSICRFSRSLQQDILYDVYGAVLEDSWVFISDSRAFLRSLVLEMSHEVILKDGYITSVNDVNKYLYILYRGTANVIAPDGTKLCTLPPGSIFGNIDDCEMTRQTVTVVASGHVEILAIEALQFHAVLNGYPRLQIQYKNLTSKHNDYLEGRGRGEDEISLTINSITSQKLLGKHPFSVCRNAVLHPRCMFIRIWQLIILIFVCYIEVCLDLYQIAMARYDIGLIIFQYLCDALYLINFCMRFHVAFENDAGVMVTDLKKIRKRILQDKVSFWCDIVSIIPLDVVAWAFPYKTFRVLHPILRFNRLVRFNYIVQYTKKQLKKLDINVLLLQLLYTILWSTFMLHCYTCVLITLSCTHTPNMYPEIVCDNMTLFDGINVYIQNYFVISSIFMRSSQSLSYPESEYMTAYLIFVMISFEMTATLFLAEIYAALQSAYHRQNKFSRYLEKIETFLEQQRISRVLQEKIRNYLKLQWRYQKGTAFPTLLAEAPSHLREAILNNAFSYHINGHFIFGKCHVDFNRQIVSCLRNTTYFRGDYIVTRGTINGSMYFIHTGGVTVLQEDNLYNETITEYLTDGASFAVTQGLFAGKEHIHSFRAVKLTVILTLSLDTWKHLLHFYPASKNVIFQQHAAYQQYY